MKTTLQLCLLLLLVVALPASAQVVVKATAAPYIAPDDGAKLYEVMCASCHGTDLLGRQPVQMAVPQHNMNLRLVSSHESAKVRSQIAFGSDANYHNVDMPAWNKILRQMYRNDENKVQLAIYNLTNYVIEKK